MDFLTTIRADQWVEAPPELLGPKMEGFRAVADLSVSAAMIGAAGRPRFVDDVERREFTVIAV